MSLPQSLDLLMELVQQRPCLPPELAAEAAALRDRLSSGQFNLAVLGQFKRGKSTLINALLGAELLPSGVLPVTLVPVFLRYAPRPALEIRYANGRGSEQCSLERLGDFVNEANNPRNHKQVSRVDLFYPAALLQNGVVLIDTPGVGSTFQHNTDTTLDFLPHCDAAIAVLSADPPITAVEVAFLQQVQPHVAQFFFVLNKSDYLEPAGLAAAKQFLCDTLRTDLGIASPQVWTVSARQGLAARMNGDDGREWSHSGMAALEQALLTFATNGKRSALLKAVQKKAADLVGQADHLLALEQQAARLPLEELEQKIAAFGDHARAARLQRQALSDQLAGDTLRLREQLEQACAALRERAQQELMRQAEALHVPTHDRESTLRFRQFVLDCFDRERAAVGLQHREATQSVLTALAQRAQALREDLRRDAASLLDVPHFPRLVDQEAIAFTEAAWTIDHLPVKLTPTWSQARWMPQAWQQRQQIRQREELVRETVVRNVEKIRYWLLRTTEENIRRFELSMNSELEETIAHIDRALQAGSQRHRDRAENQQIIAAEIDGLRARLRQLGENMATEVSIP